MSGYTEVVNTLKEIRDFLKNKMTPEFMNSVQSAANAIRNLLGDPNLGPNINDTLVQLQQLLEQIRTEDLVGKVADVAEQVRTLLAQLDPEKISSIINSLNKLLEEADKAGLIDNVIKALDSVTCLKDLVDVAKDLVLPAKVLMYGATGALIGTAISNAIQVVLNNKKDSKLQGSINQLLLLNASHIKISIEQLQIGAATFLIQLKDLEMRNPEYKLTKTENKLKKKYNQYVNFLSSLDQYENFQDLSKITEFSQKIIDIHYQSDLENETVPDYLDRVNKNRLYWGELIKFVSYNPSMVKKKEKPELPRENLNYRQVKKLYGSKQIDAIMTGLAKMLDKNGGKRLFSSLADSYEDTSHWLSECIRQIPQNQIDFADDIPWAQNIKKLHSYYHLGAEKYIKDQWKYTDWKHLPINKMQITPDVCEIIRMRALLEFCYITAPKLCFPQNVSREMLNGIIDVPVSAYQLVRHPINSITNIGLTFFTIDGLKNLASGISSHPLRFITSTGVSAGISAGISSGIHAFTQSSVGPSSHHAANSNLHLKAMTQTQSIATKSSSISHPVIGGSSAGTVPAALSGNNITTADESDTQSHNMLHSAQLDPNAYSILMRKIRDVKDLNNFYIVYLAWYNDVVIAKPSQLKINFFLDNNAPAQELTPINLSNEFSNS